MSTPKVFESEYRFCLILWDHEPIKSRDLAQLCEEQLGWKVTTTYTVIKRLCRATGLEGYYHLHGNKAFVRAWRDKE